MKATHAQTLRSHYAYLRSIESILRRQENKSVSALPLDKAEQEKVAVRAGAKNLEAFLQTCRDARAGIHGIYEEYFR